MRFPGFPRSSALQTAVIVMLLLLASRDGAAQWTSDVAANTPVCVEPTAQLNSVAVSDGAGGVIIAWVDNRGVEPADIYAQRLNASGVAQWAAAGLPICTASGDQSNAAICSDGAGGAIIAWQDFRGGTYDIYAQRVNAAGATLWAAGGVLIGAAANDQIWPMLVRDGANGAIITWEDNRAGGLNYDIYAQRVNGAGARLWPPLDGGGLAICVQPSWQAMPMLASDGAGGAIITWYDWRSEVDDDIYAQRINAGGVIQWAPNGALICGAAFGAPNRQTQPTIATDGANGAIITWYDFRTGVDWDVYAQHINALGVILWSGLGLPLCTVPNDQLYPKIISDGAGGAIVTWYDWRNTIDEDVFAQRVNAFGAPLWLPQGTPVISAGGNQEFPNIVSDGAGGAIIAWTDERISLNRDVYAQRLDAVTGLPQWPSPLLGAALTLASGNQDWNVQFIPMASDGNGGAIVTWTDARGGTATDIYAQNIKSDGTPGPPISTVADAPLGGREGVGVYPNPAVLPGVNVFFSVHAHGTFDLSIYDIGGRLVRRLYKDYQAGGVRDLIWDGRDEKGAAVSSGIYLVRLDAAGGVRTSKTFVIIQ